MGDRAGVSGVSGRHTRTRGGCKNCTRNFGWAVLNRLGQVSLADLAKAEDFFTFVENEKKCRNGGASEGLGS